MHSFSPIRNKGLKKSSRIRHIFLGLVLSVSGFFALIWILIRVIPKPSRASYPCIKVAYPFASAFIVYLTGLASSVLFLKKAREKWKQRRLLLGGVFLFLSLLALSTALYHNAQPATAQTDDVHTFTDPLGPNLPIGEAKGIFPGRVVWVHNPDATNENCTNQNKNNAYFNDQNTDQDIVDQMVSTGIQQLTGKNTLPEAWDALFRYFNQNHGKGNVGYVPGESIFIKINAVTAWSGATPDGEFSSRAGIEYDTSPQSILTILRHLINEAGVPQENIFVGDPM
ncbi:MAG TPA: hypothetical protein PLK12_18055, partial [Prolixibacteraceae bacterium]|nr:hypothetical protein [Prolixibacteraceae bacterium]